MDNKIDWYAYSHNFHIWESVFFFFFHFIIIYFTIVIALWPLQFDAEIKPIDIGGKTSLHAVWIRFHKMKNQQHLLLVLHRTLTTVDFLPLFSGLWCHLFCTRNSIRSMSRLFRFIFMVFFFFQFSAPFNKNQHTLECMTHSFTVNKLNDWFLLAI